jgi:hypothetical protein
MPHISETKSDRAISRTMGCSVLTHSDENRIRCLPVDFPHDDVQGADDGGDVGDEAAFAKLVGDA